MPCAGRPAAGARLEVPATAEASVLSVLSAAPTSISFDVDAGRGRGGRLNPPVIAGRPPSLPDADADGNDRPDDVGRARDDPGANEL